MFNKKSNAGKTLLPIFVIRDIVAESYGVPIPLESEGMAKRQFCDFLAQFNVYPHRGEYMMIHVADYCPKTATYYPIKDIDRKTYIFDDVKEAVERLRAEQGAAVGGATPLKPQSVQ